MGGLNLNENMTWIALDPILREVVDTLYCTVSFESVPILCLHLISKWTELEGMAINKPEILYLKERLKLSSFLRIFPILLDSWNIFTQRNELCWIISRNAWNVASRVTQDLYLDSHGPIWTQNSPLDAINFALSKLKHLKQLLIVYSH